jgi:molybdopterin synthase catalytic subunit
MSRSPRFPHNGPMTAAASPGDAIRLIDIRDTPLSVDEVVAAVDHPGAGGTAVFIGTVRDNDSDKLVEGLGYSAHPTAIARMREVAEKVVADHDVVRLAAVHRVGDLAIGDLAVVVAVSCGHRGEAFAACKMLIDDIKAGVPIWKHQVFTDGSSEWVGTP